MRLRPRIEPEPPRELKFRVPAETHDELELYGQLYAEEYGHEIDVPTLAAEILQQFLAADRSFKKARDKMLEALPTFCLAIGPAGATGAAAAPVPAVKPGVQPRAKKPAGPWVPPPRRD